MHALLMIALLLAAPFSARAQLLEFVEAQHEDISSVACRPVATELSPDGRHLYTVNTEGCNDPHQPTLDVFERDPIAGTLSLLASYPSTGSGLTSTDLRNADSVVISPDGANAYLTLQTAMGETRRLLVLARDQASGHLTLIGDASTADVAGNSRRRTTIVSGDGRNVYDVEGFFDRPVGEGRVNVFSRDLVSGQLTLIQANQNHEGGIEYMVEPTAVLSSPDGRHVYVLSERATITGGGETGALIVFERDLPTGTLSLVQTLRDGVDGIDGIRQIRSGAVSPDGRNVYIGGVGGSTNNTLAVFERDPVSGMLALVEVHQNQAGSVLAFDDPFDIAVHPSGDYVFAVTNGSNALVAFGRDPATGMLAFHSAYQWFNQTHESETPWFMNSPQSLTIDPEGRHIYVGSSGFSQGGVAVFAIMRDLAQCEVDVFLALKGLSRCLGLPEDGDDSDGDGFIDIVDNCPNAFNPLQENADLDGLGDACDLFPFDATNGLTQCEQGLGICTADLGQCGADLFSANADLGACQADLDLTETDLNIALVNLDMCTTGQPLFLLTTADLGPVGDDSGIGGVIDDQVFLGARFEVLFPVRTGRVGAHLERLPGGPTGQIFAAIVALDGPSDVPDSGDLSTPDVVVATRLPVPNPSAEAVKSLQATLDPGWYALVLGSGLFGATGSAVAPDINPALGAPSFFSGPSWTDGSGSASLVPRLFVGVESTELAMCVEDLTSLQAVIIDGNGDVNGDGVADLVDSVIFRRSLAGAPVQ